MWADKRGVRNALATAKVFHAVPLSFSRRCGTRAAMEAIPYDEKPPSRYTNDDKEAQTVLALRWSPLENVRGRLNLR